MERDSVEIQKVFINLVQDLGLDLGLNVSSDPDSIAINPDSIRTGEVHSELHRSCGVPSPFRKEYPLNSGDIPAVQDRFYALLKHRLQSEIQLRPPLFPWEQTVTDYQDEFVPVAETVAIPGINVRSLWLAQLRRLASLPIAMPDTVLVQLLNKCQELANSRLREGAKLVKAVESLFPGESQTLNQLAGFVMVSPARSGFSGLQERLGGDLPVSYEEAMPTQQMVLSLLAAREILSVLTINVSTAKPKVRYEWATEAGALILDTDFQLNHGLATLRVTGTLPCGSRLELRGAGRRTLAERLDAGQLSVELTDLDPSQTCVLEVQLGLDEIVVFTIYPEA
jgi:hypothetical protein